MSVILESPAAFPDSPMDQDDVVYPCKGCGEILEEGKAFELAGNRWHIDCFRCNTCGTLLDSDANLLLLGDGSLICNNCTYSCSACGNKIEDLAILTGDQAFCASCFRCRNCKRKIENLRYARTSQGIFCMSCHESLMAKRRKHKKAQRQAPSGGGTKDKALPDLPRTDSQTTSQTVFTPSSDLDTPPTEKYSDPAEPSPRPQQLRSRKDRVNGAKRDESPASIDSRKDNLTLPASTYKDNQASSKSKSSIGSTSYDGASGDDGIFVPFLLDTSPAVGGAVAASKNRELAEVSSASPPQPEQPKQPASRDYFQRKPAPSAARDAIREVRQEASRSSSGERMRSESPHIGHQEKPRQPADQPADTMRRRKEVPTDTATTPKSGPNDGGSTSLSYATASSTQGGFKLQDVPKNRKAGSQRSSKSDNKSPSLGSPAIDTSIRNLSPQIDLPSISPTADPNKARKESDGLPNQSSSSDQLPRPPPLERPKRGDSLQARTTMEMNEVASAQSSGPTTPTAPPGLAHDRNATPLVPPRQAPGNNAPPQVNGKIISNPIELGSSRSLLDAPNAPPARSSSRPAPPGTPSASDSFTSPRAAPPPPPVPQPGDRHRANESTSTAQSETQAHVSPVNLPRYSIGGDFSMDEDMARILRGEEPYNEPGVLRKVSNAVKHGRSFSDRGTRSVASSSGKWSVKSPLNGIDISSPTSAQSPDAKDDNSVLRHELRRARQRIAELEAEKNSILHQSADLSEVSSQLQDKRNTMAFLNSQREIVVRELEIMTDQLQKAKDSNQPINLKTLKSEVLHDLTSSIHKLKESLSREIESLVKQKDDLTDEISKLIAMKDKGFQEYESLSTRNAQLTQHNNELIHSIQDFYKANRQPNGASFDGGRPLPNGLGIQLHKDRGEPNVFGYEPAVPGMMPDNESDTFTPKVVDIRKGNKQNMLKKGTQGFLRGVRGAFNADKDRSQERNGSTGTEGVPYGQISDATVPRSATEGPGRQKFGGLFGGSDKASSSKISSLKQTHGNASNPSLASDTTVGAACLFGGDLTVRCDVEKRVIPGIVTRCIEEVELRGMDVEGIYRKSGGSSQVNQVKNGFEANNDCDISDIDLDIHAVTSALKQYFRRLPTPLITYDVYDPLLSAAKVEDHGSKVIKMRNCLDQLPRSHRDCLEFLMFHLSRVMEKEKLNLMGSSNLAVVFAPTLLRPQTIEREMTDMQIQRSAIQFLLDNSKIIFTDS